MNVPPLNLREVRVRPLAERKSLSCLQNMLVDPDTRPAVLGERAAAALEDCAAQVRQARSRNATVLLMYGAHLVKNGAMAIVNRLIADGWITHAATNGAGTIHDWELSYLGCTEESVRENVAQGCFGTWDETGQAIHLAVLTGAMRGEGFGTALGRFIEEDGVDLPSGDELVQALRAEPEHPLSPARAELLQVMLNHNLSPGRRSFRHPNKATSIVAEAFRRSVPFTVHPGIGYDIYCTHPMFNGAAIGRAAGYDFGLFSRAVEGLDYGVVLSVGSAIMAPQVFEKSLSCVNNLRLAQGRPIVKGHSIYVVDIQDGGGWDWSQGEPPKSNPAYYLRFCKSFARMGGAMKYVQADNVGFLHHLMKELSL